MKHQGAQRYEHAEHVSWRRVEDEAVLLDLDTSAYFSLNEVGALIWESLGSGTPLDEIKSAVCGEYEVSDADVENDISRLIKELLKKNLLRPRTGDKP